MVASTDLKKGFFTSFSKSHAGKVRPYNEDAMLELCQQGVWVVADGMGGHSAGDIASQMVIDAVQQYVENTPKLSQNIDGLKQCLISVNRKILSYSTRYLDGKTAGSTVVVLMIRDGFFHCLWAGDSRIYLLRHRNLRRKTRDHSQVMDMVEQGLIEESQAESHPLSNVITRAVGVSVNFQVDQVSGELLPGDQFLLCSDGLTKELNDHEIAVCMQAENVADSGLALMHSALVKGANDNVTCVVVKVNDTADSKQKDYCADDTIPVFFTKR